MVFRSAFTLGVLLAAGCAGPLSAPPAGPAGRQPVLVSAAVIPAPPGPTAPAMAREAGVSAEAAAPVYRPPRIAKIYLRAHQDASGRLVGPQVIYQVIEPGGWNLEALERTVPEPPLVVTPDAGWFLLPPAATSAPAPVQSVQPAAAR